MRPIIDVKKVMSHLDKIIESGSKEASPEYWYVVSTEFTLNGPTQSILAHCVRVSLGVRRSLALTDCESRAWPDNRCMNP